MSQWTQNQRDVLDEANKVVPAIAAATSRADKVLLVQDMQQYAIEHGLAGCQVYPVMFSAAMHWLSQAVNSVAAERGVEPAHVLQEMSMAAAARQANAV